MTPTPGRIVLYVLNQLDVDAINRRRVVPPDEWPAGVQAHVGNEVRPGDIVPAIVVRGWSDVTINAQAILDGNDTYWLTSAPLGQGPGTWYWPVKTGG